MIKVEVAPRDILGFWLENVEELRENYLLLASNDDAGTAIYLTEENEKPILSVDMDGEEIVASHTDPMELVDEYSHFIRLYISERSQNLGDEESDDLKEDLDIGPDIEEDFTDEQLLRIADIQCAMEDFLNVLMDMSLKDADLSEDDVNELVFLVEKALAEDYGISCRHPYIEEDGTVNEWPFLCVENEVM